MTINSVNNGLNGQTGTGSFVGSVAPVLTGSIDYGGATTLKIPNGAAPTVSTKGDIAIDTTFTDFKGMLTYFSAAQQYAPGILPADLSTVDGYAVVYDATNDKFVMAAQSGSGGKIIKVGSGDSVTTESTTSTSYVDTSLTASFTPLSASSTLFIQVYARVSATGSSTDSALGFFNLRRTSGTPVNFGDLQFGFTDNGSGAPAHYNSLFFAVQEPSVSTASHTYVLQYKSNSASITTAVTGSVSRAYILIWELV